MKRKIKHIYTLGIFLIFFFIFIPAGLTDDTCVFQSTADDMPPLIVLLLDNGAAMQHIVWPDAYDNSIDYAPRDGVDNDSDGVIDEADEIDDASDPEIAWRKDVVKQESLTGTLTLAGVTAIFVNDETLTGDQGGAATVNTTLGADRLSYDTLTEPFVAGEVVTGGTSGATGTIVSISNNTNGFYNENGYGIVISGSKHYLVAVQDNLDFGTCCNKSQGDIFLKQDVSGKWTINGRTVTLPAEPSSTEVDGVIDRAVKFRYSMNYLNWLFFAKDATDSPLYTGDGTDLPDKSRFYHAKKAIFTVAYSIRNAAKLAIRNFTSNYDGSSSVQPLGFVLQEDNNGNLILDANGDPILISNFENNINNMGPVTYSPLAEGLAGVGGYFASNAAGVTAPDGTEIVQEVVQDYCERLFTIVISPGTSSEDKTDQSSDIPATLSDFDGDGTDATDINGTLTGTPTVTIYVNGSPENYTVPVGLNGSTYLDDVAYYLRTHDVPTHNKAPGIQTVSTYTIGFMGNAGSNAFLMNTSNLGNNITDPDDPEYGAFHFEAADPASLADQLQKAINLIVEQTSTFTAPVVPVTRTTSGDNIYLAFFKPINGQNFWEGHVTKFGISTVSTTTEGVTTKTIQITDRDGDPATWPNGAIMDDALPFWSTRDWADPSKPNYIYWNNRKIYTFLDAYGLILFRLEGILFGYITPAMLDYPTDIYNPYIPGKWKVASYVHGVDVYDEDEDGIIAENREVITGDVLHSEPAVIEYNRTGFQDSVIYFGANDGMLHAVLDSDGTEMWGFIPPDQLPRLKFLMEGTEHPYFVDASPKVYISDANNNGVVDDGETAILICGERRGGSNYIVLNITNPSSPVYMGSIGPSFLPELGETWSEPMFGRVKINSTGDEKDVFFIGGGFSPDNSKGRAVYAISLDDLSIVKQWDVNDNAAMTYSIPSNVKVVDENNNGLIDKIYVGDLGGQMWRIGQFTDVATGNALPFPNTNEDITTWTAEVIFNASDNQNTRKINYPPAVTLEKGFDMVFFGTGDRQNACAGGTSDGIYAVVDQHQTPISTPLVQGDLVDISTSNTLPQLPADNGFYLPLASGEKVLSEGIVFYKVLYMTTFTPDLSDPCRPGGFAKLYALKYLTGEPGPYETIDIEIGGGIPSKPVLVIPPGDTEARIIISVGSTKADPLSPDTSAGPTMKEPGLPPNNFFYRWWRVLP